MTAATTRSRRSKDKLEPSLLASKPSQQVESDSRPSGNPPSIQSKQIALSEIF